MNKYIVTLVVDVLGDSKRSKVKTYVDEAESLEAAVIQIDDHAEAPKEAVSWYVASVIQLPDDKYSDKALVRACEEALGLSGHYVLIDQTE